MPPLISVRGIGAHTARRLEEWLQRLPAAKKPEAPVSVEGAEFTLTDRPP